MELLKQLLHYLNPATWFVRSQESGRMRFMHAANRISLLIFLVGFTVIVVRACNR